jgi:hypothetical protein
LLVTYEQMNEHELAFQSQRLEVRRPTALSRDPEAASQSSSIRRNALR